MLSSIYALFLCVSLLYQVVRAVCEAGRWVDNLGCVFRLCCALWVSPLLFSDLLFCSGTGCLRIGIPYDYETSARLAFELTGCAFRVRNVQLCSHR